jgi:hypothetical protein
VALAVRNAMGEPFISVTRQYGLSIADDIRFMAISTNLVEAREAKGLTLTEILDRVKSAGGAEEDRFGLLQ